jgi:hypothetical protein
MKNLLKKYLKYVQNQQITISIFGAYESTKIEKKDISIHC